MSTAAQRAKAELFRRLHEGPDLLVLCNTSDVASSRLVVEAGFPAVATSSAGVAWLLGYPDGEKIGRAEMLDMVRRIAAGVPVPVTADMEAAYGTRPEDVAETVRLTIAAGAVGINVEDAVKSQSDLLDFKLAVERIRAARQAADAAGVPMVVNARTDGYLRGGKGAECFKETVRRANAFRAAGADCLFVPGVRDAETIGALCKEIDGPVNILAAAPSPPLPEMKRLGVRRVSIGGLLSLAAGTLVRRAAQELKGPGTYSFAKDVIFHPEMNKLLG
jgi:2-methylisocitrate lyase-like PEP mutase family enzyme